MPKQQKQTENDDLRLNAQWQGVDKDPAEEKTKKEKGLQKILKAKK